MTALWAVSGVFYMDVSEIPTPSITNALYENVTFSFFTLEDVVDLTTGGLPNHCLLRFSFEIVFFVFIGEVIFPSWKKEIAGHEWFNNAVPSNDILSRVESSQWRKTARRLIDCKEMNVTNYSPSSIVPMIPGIQVVLDRTSAVGFGADLSVDSNNTYVASFQRMLASVKVLGIL